MIIFRWILKVLFYWTRLQSSKKNSLQFEEQYDKMKKEMKPCLQQRKVTVALWGVSVIINQVYTFDLCFFFHCCKCCIKVPSKSPITLSAIWWQYKEYVEKSWQNGFLWEQNSTGNFLNSDEAVNIHIIYMYVYIYCVLSVKLQRGRDEDLNNCMHKNSSLFSFS